MIYGYARVSTHQQVNGNSLEAQKNALNAAGAEQIYMDVFTGTKTERPEFSKLLRRLKDGDTLIVTKLDRFARSLSQAIKIIAKLLEKNVTLHVLNIGIIDNTPASKLMRNMLLAFAEFERDMIIERTQEGKAIARERPDYREGRPYKYSRAQIENALEMLNTNTYEQVVRATGISKSTLIKAKRSKEIKNPENV